MSALKLRRGTVVSADPLTVSVEGTDRRAWADEGMVGEVREGDEVIVNVEALDLGLGSGGFDVVHANLSRGLEAPGNPELNVFKLNYTSLQHPVEPVEIPYEGGAERTLPVLKGTAAAVPVLVVGLHGQLAPAAWAASRAAPGLRVGYVQTPGGALPGRLSQDVAALRERDLVAGHVTAGPAYGGEREAVSVVGAIHAAAASLGWEAVIAGPGPGILGSATALGHGGTAALDSAHAALALGLRTLVCPRLSGADERPRHRGLSHHTEVVLRLLLAPVVVPVPEVDEADWPLTDQPGEKTALDRLREACDDRHDVLVRRVDLEGYAASGLPTRTMGRELAEDRLFFAAPLAAGDALASLARQNGRTEEAP